MMNNSTGNHQQQQPQSRSCSRARAGTGQQQRSGSSTPVLGSSRLPSRPSSPSRLRSLPSVGISTVEALSDAARVEETAAEQQHGITGEEELEDWGRSKDAHLPPPRSPATCKFAEEPLIESGISDYTFIPKEEGGLLGKGKFSSVQLAWKHGVKYAVKITPLYPHHNLIATRLLREPTILAQLPLHPNLVKVYESIRTPGHFYLVEEYLDGYTNLETFVSSQPNSKLTAAQSVHIFYQLVSVVRSALHEPIQIAHRDIKPENILIHPITLRIILLDFGLATHFSAREARLTTCCGSPAFHSPELVKSLRSPPGTVKYWGSEIDIWTIGVTLLRCISGIKYPLGVQHTSLQHLNDKTIDAVLNVSDRDLRALLAGLLDMNGEKRIEFFKNLPSEIDQIPFKTLDAEEKQDYLLSPLTTTLSLTNGANTPSNMNGFNRQFKNTTFIETQPKHSLSLILVTSPTNSASQSGIQDLQSSYQYQYQENSGQKLSSFLRSRSHSRDMIALANNSFSNNHNGVELNAVNERLGALNPLSNYNSHGPSVSSSTSTPLASDGPISNSTNTSTTSELILLNPQGEPAMRAISYVKYALRCAGILYHCQAPSEDLAHDKPSLKAPKDNLTYPILHCVRLVTAKEMEKSPATSSLLNQIRPPLLRSATVGGVAAATRSISQPPSRQSNKQNKNGKGSDETVKCAEFWIQIIPVFAIDTNAAQNNAKTSTTKERSSSQKRRPKSSSRHVSSANVHHYHHNYHHENTRRCTKLRIRCSDETQLDILKKALAGSSSETMDNYAMYATPPPRRSIPLPSKKNSTSTTSGEDTEASAETSSHEEGDLDRGRTKLSRSRSNEKAKSKSRSRTRTGRPPAYTAPVTDAPNYQPQPQQQYRHHTQNAMQNGDETPQIPKTNSQQEEESTTKRGFFDFVTAFNMRSKPSTPTTVATAPTTPAAIEEESEPQPVREYRENENSNRQIKKKSLSPVVAFAPM